MLRLRQRQPTEIIDAGLALLRGRYARLVALAAVPLLPYLIISLALTIHLGRSAEDVYWLQLWPLYFACGAVAHASVAVAISDVYHGRELDTASALRRVGRHLGVVVATATVAWSLEVLGLILIAPGLFLLTQFFAIPIVAVLEDRGFTASFRRSGKLATGHRKIILASYGLTLLVLTLLSYGVEAIVGGGLLLEERPVALNIVSNLLWIFLAPVYASVATLLYYDLRIRSEGYDVEVLAAAIGESNPGDAAAPAPPLRPV